MSWTTEDVTSMTTSQNSKAASPSWRFVTSFTGNKSHSKPQFVAREKKKQKMQLFVFGCPTLQTLTANFMETSLARMPTTIQAVNFLVTLEPLNLKSLGIASKFESVLMKLGRDIDHISEVSLFKVVFFCVCG